MPEKLKPCPFCGGEARLQYIGNNHTKKRAVHIGCSTPGCTVEIRVAAIYKGHDWCEKIAREKWSNRPGRNETIEECAMIVGLYAQVHSDELALPLREIAALLRALTEEE